MEPGFIKISALQYDLKTFDGQSVQPPITSVDLDQGPGTASFYIAKAKDYYSIGPNKVIWQKSNYLYIANLNESNVVQKISIKSGYDLLGATGGAGDTFYYILVERGNP
jgi:hypothetical protein